MKTSLLICTVLLSLTLVSCSSNKELAVNIHPDAQFRGLLTYNILHVDTLEHPLFLEKILRKEMDDMGFKYDSISPDFSLTYAGKVDKRYAVQRMMPGMYGPGWDWYGMPPYGPAYSTYEYLESTIVIDFLDLKNEKILWQGSQMNRINNTPSKKDISKAVQTIFRQFAAQYGRKSGSGKK